MAQPPRVLVVEHEHGTDAHLVGAWLVEEGCVLDVVRPYLGDAVGADATAYDAVLVLGGERDAWDDAAQPWLPRTRELVRDAAGRATPLLGICMGHQVAVLALGGKVGRNPAGETKAVAPVGWAAEAADDPLLAGVSGARVAVHVNRDVALSLPPGTQVLALTADGAPQAVRLAPTVWGVQCHPEADAALIDRWVGPEDAELVQQVSAAGDELVAGWRPLATGLAALAREAAARRTEQRA